MMDQKVKVEKKERAVARRHQRIWSFLWHTVAPLFKHIYHYSCELAPVIDGPCLVIPNHTMELDPVLVGMSFKKQMYFIASEHVYRKGWISKLLYWAFEPIAKIKGSSDTLTVMKAIRKLRSGLNVCLFAEGNRTFDGRNYPVSEATGKLVRTSGATLITYRIEGGYLTNPRWGFGIRKGHCSGHVVNIYTPDQIKQMSLEELNSHIVQDIDENAYERQKTERIAYKGKNTARGMECAFCICPKCRSLGTIKTQGDEVFCTKCGAKTTYDAYGEFTGDFGVKNTCEWEDLQEEAFKKIVEDATGNGPFFEDSGVLLRTLDSSHNEVELGVGKMALYKDRFVFEGTAGGSGININLEQISDMAVYSRNGFVFSDSAGTHYEIKPVEKHSPLNVRKYISIWKILRGG